MAIKWIKYIAIIWISITTMALQAATIPDWQIIPSKSRLIFHAIQNNAPVMGSFSSFKGDIHFSPAELQASHIRIVIAMDSVTSNYKAIGDMLKKKDWFDVKDFPEAIFEAAIFKKIANNHYQANGELTIRNKKAPVILDFSILSYSPQLAKVVGKTHIKRTTFGVGQREWLNTSVIKDAVAIQFDITAEANPH